MLLRIDRYPAAWMLLGVCLATTAPGIRASDTRASATGAKAIAAQGDAQRGVPPCAGCHGAEGQGNGLAAFPRLAGLPARYLRQQLETLADGQRNSAVMSSIAKALSPDEVSALSAYYSELPVPASSPQRAGSDPAAAAELAEHGRADDRLPACVLCHGRRGVGIGDDFPPLAGQSATYIANQLEAWKAGARPAGPMGLMPRIAAKLSESDIRGVSAYFAAQPATRDVQP
ncbi:c-type cytochrome [Rhodanobacter sp. 7MK24]|uniref:c-type cytochrome n=1 Tax=Rhodanobacter sp. 7MK24 TaxID=2775922 RepID=UPI001CE1EE56|nr:c-type cytochrome [Rhodanobacter sp. 7MK24]